MSDTPPPIPTPITAIPHFAEGARRRGDTDRTIAVDAPRPPTVKTPGRTVNQWLASGELLSLDTPCEECGWLRDGACRCQ
ncbi:Uncharacterised protein [Nocardia africana]|uniref:Uncharacterized protein n=1 Tax=Nocardia africana TaxID=134964 RepID=A0A379X4J6_9NOCA|nr:Uncharacterised protein [Nocardia africana]